MRVAQALGVPPATLLSTKDVTDRDSPAMAAQIATLDGQLGNLVTAKQIPGIDPERYLEFLRHRIEVLQGEGADVVAINLLKEQIKSFCVHAEIYGTMVGASENGRGVMRFACSAAMDNGIQTYADDAQWKLLLTMMGSAAKTSRKSFIRIIFLNFERNYSNVELFTLKNIILEHLKYLVRVALFPASDLDDELDRKKNMAVLGQFGVLAATDQISWDLGFSESKGDIVEFIDKHQALLDTSQYVFQPGDEERIFDVLCQLIPHQET